MTIVCKLSRAAMAATAAVLLLQVPTASALPILVSLSSSPADLTNLTVGDPITINVDVSGFADSDTLSALSADVLLPDSFFSLPMTPTPGPLGPTGFLSTSLNLSPNHSASGAYSDMMVGDPPITSDQLFFAFDAVASAAGSGLILFDEFAPPQLFGSNDSGLILDINAGAPLPFNITGGPAAVIPEPATLYVALLALLMLRRVARRRRR